MLYSLFSLPNSNFLSCLWMNKTVNLLFILQNCIWRKRVRYYKNEKNIHTSFSCYHIMRSVVTIDITWNVRVKAKEENTRTQTTINISGIVVGEDPHRRNYSYICTSTTRTICCFCWTALHMTYIYRPHTNISTRTIRNYQLGETTVHSATLYIRWRHWYFWTWS